MKTLAILLIRVYQWCIRPLIGQSCRFYPSCSEYTLEAFQKYGFFQGIYLGAKRILRCNPWCNGGHDPLH